MYQIWSRPSAHYFPLIFLLPGCDHNLKLCISCWFTICLIPRLGALGRWHHIPCFLSEYLHRLCVLSQVQLFAAPWPEAHQASLSMGFSRQEYWSRLPFLTPGDLLNPGIELTSLLSPAFAGRFFTNCATWGVHNYIEMVLTVIRVKPLWLNSACGGGRARSFCITYALSGSHKQFSCIKTFIFKKSEAEGFPWWSSV